MTSLLGAHNISKAFGTQELFEDLSLTLVEKEKVGLVGPNGAGKSTFLKIIAGLETPDTGHISKRQGLKIGYASQSPEFDAISCEDTLLKEVGDTSIDSLIRAQTLLSKAQFEDTTQIASTLSGGWKKRLDIARALMNDPDLLLLDEPTNHLDLEGILWLEKFLQREKRSLLIVSHDRTFLQNVCNKIIELNRCFEDGLFISDGDMATYWKRKEDFIQGQLEKERSLSSVLVNEIDWLKRSPKARTTKSRSRVEKTYQMMEELAEIKRRNAVKKVSIDFNASERETRNLLIATNLSKSLGGRELFKGVNIRLNPGKRLGIVGKNGTGKTTLLKMLAGQITPDLGTIKLAQDLKLVYFDQHREQLDPSLTLREALSPNKEFVEYRGQEIHVNGWARKFLFSKERLELPLRVLSGGEKARILIARLMLQPADILFLDEPTNDLDIQTLEVIEESLQEFAGAVALITHDRSLMDRVCNQILGLGLDSEEHDFADYKQWEKAALHTTEKSVNITKTQKSASKSSSKKLSYKEQKELEGMEAAILNCEAAIDFLQTSADQEVNDPKKSLELYNQLAAAGKNLETLFERWQYLMDKNKAD
ncbi:MAG: ABC-F family ATP-binding cassette domain-containing protein [Parachlamydiales bacterium]|nr:ABC-F family ATP-binding cassette domain-containing protein [Parachlamydiales bacterium]